MAVSDGDLEAALAQYEAGGVPGHLAATADQRRRRVPRRHTCSMALRLPLAVQIVTVLRVPDLALVVCERQTAGTGPDGEEIKYRGHGCAAVRAQPDGTWRIASDAWHLGTEDLQAGHPGTEVPL